MVRDATDITVKVVRHAETGLLVAVSDQVKGLFAHGRTHEEVHRNTHEALKAIYAARGQVNVVVMDLDEDGTPAFDSMELRFQAVEGIAA